MKPIIPKTAICGFNIEMYVWGYNLSIKYFHYDSKITNAYGL